LEPGTWNLKPETFKAKNSNRQYYGQKGKDTEIDGSQQRRRLSEQNESGGAG